MWNNKKLHKASILFVNYGMAVFCWAVSSELNSEAITTYNTEQEIHFVPDYQCKHTYKVMTYYIITQTEQQDNLP